MTFRDLSDMMESGDVEALRDTSRNFEDVAAREFRAFPPTDDGREEMIALAEGTLEMGRTR